MFTYWIRFLYRDGSIAPGWRAEIWSNVGRSDGGVTDRNGWVELHSLYDSVTSLRWRQPDRHDGRGGGDVPRELTRRSLAGRPIVSDAGVHVKPIPRSPECTTPAGTLSSPASQRGSQSHQASRTSAAV